MNACLSEDAQIVVALKNGSDIEKKSATTKLIKKYDRLLWKCVNQTQARVVPAAERYWYTNDELYNEYALVAIDIATRIDPFKKRTTEFRGNTPADVTSKFTLMTWIYRYIAAWNRKEFRRADTALARNTRLADDSDDDSAQEAFDRKVYAECRIRNNGYDVSEEFDKNLFNCVIQASVSEFTETQKKIWNMRAQQHMKKNDIVGALNIISGEYNRHIRLIKNIIRKNACRQMSLLHNMDNKYLKDFI